MRIRKLFTVILLVLASFTTAFTAAQVVHAAPASASVAASSHARPVWDGHGTYDSGIEPMCPAADAWHWAIAGKAPHAFTVRCEPDGRYWAWTAASKPHTRLWWDGATCRAFGSGRIHLMVLDSRHADTYIRSDAALWAHDGKRRASRHTLELDRSYVLMDCTLTGDQG